VSAEQGTVFPGVPWIESPLFPRDRPRFDLGGEDERIAHELHLNGFAVFDFPDRLLDKRIERIQRNLAPCFAADMTDRHAHKLVGEGRVQDAWHHDSDVRAIATNPEVRDLLSRLYGRRAFPFQTLNFPVGTQQAAHSDSVHFSSLPERFMCGVWLAMEDVTAERGPLFYYPGSHRWPIVSNAMIGRRGYGSSLNSAQDPYAPAWDALIEATGTMPETFLARKGQALIWCANLLHGGSPQTDPCATRWSQVTHYFFEDCVYYTPAFSDEALGRLDLRRLVSVEDGLPRQGRYLGEPVTPTKARAGLWQRLKTGCRSA
jgi:hypothetical protein